MRPITQAWFAGISLGAFASIGLAGGGGQNMLLIVNPNDEASLRMANAYVQARAIPERNILYLSAPSEYGNNPLSTSFRVLEDVYFTAINNALSERGLAGQIDYIGTLGQPHTVKGVETNWQGKTQSISSAFNYALAMKTQFERGLPYPSGELRPSAIFQTTVPYSVHNGGGTPPPLPYTPGTNATIHHDLEYSNKPGTVVHPGTPYDDTYNTQQWYMSGNIGYSGQFGITTQQYIDSYARSAGADGTKPEGTVYFIDSESRRSGTRSSSWRSVQQYMTEHGIPWEEAYQQYIGSPINKSDVRGALLGAANYPMPNGSTYLPGSYSDNVTSNGATYGNSAHTKADKAIRAGAAATAGAIFEPYTIPSRFTNAMMYVYADEGSTLGESFFKSVSTPDAVMFHGDLLSQAYADVPNVAFTTAPADGATVGGTISIGASASVTNAKFATGVAELQLYVDGLHQGTLSAESGTFSLDTAGLADGRHEIRIVGINNSAAETQGYTRRFITVDNQGQSVFADGQTYSAQHDQILQIPITAIAGTGAAVQRIELRSLGRTVATMDAGASAADLDASLLAFGDNSITPVAILSNGSQVMGNPITVTRDFNRMPGTTPSPLSNRIPGFTFEYFTGRADITLDRTDFSGTPDYNVVGTVLSIDPESTNPDFVNFPSQYTKINNGRLAVRVKASFQITTEGEYSFFYETGGSFEGLRFAIDGLTLQSYDLLNFDPVTGKFLSRGSVGGDSSRTVYLLPGEHSMELLLTNPIADADSSLTTLWYIRDASGDSVRMDSSMFYTFSPQAVPEPATLGIIGLALGTLMTRRRSKVNL